MPDTSSAGTFSTIGGRAGRTSTGGVAVVRSVGGASRFDAAHANMASRAEYTICISPPGK